MFHKCLVLVRKVVSFQKYRNGGGWEVEPKIEIYVFFISDFERTKNFHFLYIPFEKDQKRTKVAKFSK